jgi:hypothetical protein
MPTVGLVKRGQLFTGSGGRQLKRETRKREVSDRRVASEWPVWLVSWGQIGVKKVKCDRAASLEE